MGVTINYLLLIVNGQQLFKKGGGDIALEVTSYQLPVTSNQLLLLLLLLLIINNSAKRIQNWG